jgi:radical SAM-linked protein
MPAPKNRPTGPEPPPVVQQLLVRYAKRGRMRFASIRDVQRAFERAVRQAGLPIAHSAGFSPHPKISYASGTQTGVSSEAEYLTLALTAPVDSAGMRSVLDRALPDGIDVIEVVEDFGGSLNGRLMVSEWLVELPGVAPDAAEAAARTFLAASEVPVERLTNKGIRRFDARAAVLTLAVSPRAGTIGHHECATIRMVVRHTEPAVRPEDVLNGMLPGGAASVKPAVAVTRVAQGILGPEGGASAVVAPTPAKVNVP